MWRSEVVFGVINAEDAEARRRRENSGQIVNLTISVASCRACSHQYQINDKKLRVSAPLRFQHLARQKGFTLLELVMVIVVIAILATVALDRFWSLQVAAERAMIQQVTGNIRSALGMEVARFALDGRVGELPQLDGSNPMLLLAQTPVGYLGEVSPDSAEITEASWYFDPNSQTLNYRVSYGENFDSHLEQPALLRWRIHLIYQDHNHNQQLDPGIDAINGLNLVRLEN